MLNDKGEEVGIIYGWYNIKNEKWYIGQTIYPEGRFKTHINRAINKKDNTHFHRALRKYGLENWVYCVLESNVLRENLNLKEQEWIEYYDSFYCGYNETTGGGQIIFSEEVKEKMREIWKGKHHTEKTKKKISESHKGLPTWNKGRIGVYSEETKRKMSESAKRRLPNNGKKICKYDLNGNYIQTYINIAEAIRQNPKCSNISKVCRGKRKQAGGFIWKYA